MNIAALYQSRTPVDPIVSADVAAQAALRRTFAIISHPDAGKTTLTEKLLLYSGMVRTAGMVRARKGGKAASSDWMAMEQERGISITASAMQFPYKGKVINVLDTPGHQDFSEDTYRTLTAADSAIMVIDAAKGVEAQTRKLFAVCRMRGVPILTFINKMDLPGRDPLELMTEVEDALGIQATPMNWPIGSGKSFIGVTTLADKQVLLFSRSAQGGALKALVESIALSSLEGSGRVDADLLTKLNEDIELLETAGNGFDPAAFMEGKLTPVFFGSALTNFGVEPFFDNFVSLAPAPRATIAIVRGSTEPQEVRIDPSTTGFSGFVFKIQANMNPKHRDSMAFIRICSGRFERDMTVFHHRMKKEVRLSRAYSMVAQDRNTTDYAYPGDVVGVINPGAFAIGDTISIDGGFDYRAMPSFPPEVIGQIRPLDVLKYKSFVKGMEQLSLEGAVQILRSFETPEGAPYVAAVGKLQFDVLQFRLEHEYGVKTHLDIMPYRFSSYLEGGDPRTLRRPQSSFVALDARDRVVLLFTGEWEKNFILERNPEVQLVDFVTT